MQTLFKFKTKPFLRFFRFGFYDSCHLAAIISTYECKVDFSLQACIAVKFRAKLRCFKRPLARPFSQLSVSHFGLKGFLKGKEDKSWRENCFSSSLLLIPSKLELSLGGFAVRLFGKKKNQLINERDFLFCFQIYRTKVLSLPEASHAITSGIKWRSIVRRKKANRRQS